MPWCCLNAARCPLVLALKQAILKTAMDYLVVVSCLLAIPAVASAASDDSETCGDLRPPDWERTGEPARAIFAEGVLPLPFTHSSIVDLQTASFTVTDDQGELVPGALEDGARGRSLWRPESALNPAIRYTASLAVPDLSPEEWSFDVDPGAAATIAAEDFVTGRAYVVEEELHGGTLVCCDGAFPALSGHGDVLCFDGLCGSTSAVGKYELQIENPAEASDAATANSVVFQSGATRYEGDLLCATLAVTDLTTGEEASRAEHCDPRPEGELGAVEVDPLPDLIQACVGEPYRCEREGESDLGHQWDPDACEVVTDVAALDDDDGSGALDGSGNSGCGCSSDSTSAPGFLAGVFLLLLGRRRGTRFSR